MAVKPRMARVAGICQSPDRCNAGHETKTKMMRDALAQHAWRHEDPPEPFFAVTVDMWTTGSIAFQEITYGA